MNCLERRQSDAKCISGFYHFLFVKLIVKFLFLWTILKFLNF